MATLGLWALTYINQFVFVTCFQIVKHTGIVQVCQVGHILSLLILGRIHLLQQVFFHRSLLGAVRGRTVGVYMGCSGCEGKGFHV